MSTKSRLASLLGATERTVGRQGMFMGGWILLLWLIEIVRHVVPALNHLGVEPRRLSELPSILTAPFLHFGFGHLAANTLPLLVLGWLTLASGWRRFWIASLTIAIGAGLGVWLLARPGNHAGASLLIFGYFGYLITFGFLQRSIPWILVAVAVGGVYGSVMLAGLAPLRGAVSWEGHLFGILGGALAAWLLRPRTTPPISSLSP